MTYVRTTWADYGVPCIEATTLNNAEDGIDRAQGDVMVLYDTTANIPASDPLLVGRLYYESDLLTRVWRDNGGGWDLVATPAVGGVWVFIAETVLGAPAAVVTFAAIPQIYRTLWLFAEARTDRVTEVDGVGWQANADAGNNYDYVYFFAQIALHNNGGARAAAMGYLGNCEAANSRAANFGPSIGAWEDYASATIEKSSLTPLSARAGDRNADADVEELFIASWWRSTAAITRLDFVPFVGPNFVAGSTFTLYGIT